MSKPYYRMTLKELLEFLCSSDDAVDGKRPSTCLPRIQYFNGGINGSLGVRIDEETLHRVIENGGIHSIVNN